MFDSAADTLDTYKDTAREKTGWGRRGSLLSALFGSQGSDTGLLDEADLEKAEMILEEIAAGGGTIGGRIGSFSRKKSDAGFAKPLVELSKDLLTMHGFLGRVVKRGSLQDRAQRELAAQAAGLMGEGAEENGVGEGAEETGAVEGIEGTCGGKQQGAGGTTVEKDQLVPVLDGVGKTHLGAHDGESRGASSSRLSFGSTLNHGMTIFLGTASNTGHRISSAGGVAAVALFKTTGLIKQVDVGIGGGGSAAGRGLGASKRQVMYSSLA